ncbi:MAG TPA: uracil-DNA glycosylase family protein [Chloroflexota bacterium]|nr:uracil-DNA glycosylase family protein [Chloroflexota bacterium]
MAENLQRLHADIRACDACVAAGFIPRATPIATAQYAFDEPLSERAYVGPKGAGRIMLIGQAPGQLEAVDREHFVGRAGRVLFRWLARIGVDEAAFRQHVYVTAVTKCFPGKAAVAGGGDRRPSPAEVRLCRPFLDRQIALLDAKLILLTGKMAIDFYLPGRSLDGLVGCVFEADGWELLPLPHPSGMSRWLNSLENQAKLDQALQLLRDRLAPGLRMSS